MALHYELAKIENWKERCFVEKDGYDGYGTYMRSVTEALIFATMLLGVTQITEKNFEKVYERNLKLGKIGITFLTDKGKGRVFTRKEIEDHIGLGTNASTMTNAAFNKNLLRIIDEEVKRRIRYEENKRNKEKENVGTVT